MQLPSSEIIKTGISNPGLGQRVRLYCFLGSLPALFLSDFPKGKIVEIWFMRLWLNEKKSNMQEKDKRWLCALHSKNKTEKNEQKMVLYIFFNFFLKSE